ncbi:hypothetical protein M413DRAFT_6646 [Hebeloma cylindrosporum]|uniref:F-box domain-containing protein n=1 Tax=Hebeloma cylindrosporum TaxID=76867 RepID=A0A0C2Z9B4_HEBCY|nr:hypothetical protein M413DRAFT_6646 [Hebeloma cylindrosporum h7]
MLKALFRRITDTVFRRESDANLVGRLERENLEAQARCDAIYISNKETPFLSLPIEIISSIFCEAHSTTGVSREGNHIRVHLIEVVISHVCRQWRSTAIGLPILWSSFCYHGRSGTYPTLRRFEIYLQRSKENTLELGLDFRKPIRNPELNSAVLDMALAVVSRWRLVSIFSDGGSCNPTSTPEILRIKLKNLHAPHLEHLALFPNLFFETLEDLASLSNRIGPHVFTEGAPMLKSVWLNMSAHYLYLPPLSGVTTLRIESFVQSTYSVVFPLDMLRTILTLPYLENLSMFEAFCDTDVALERIPLITMDRLKHLRLRDSDAVFRFLGIVRAPLLESIMCEQAIISVGCNHAQGDTYSFPSLTSLVIFDATVKSLDCLRNFMEMTSAVRHVTILHSRDSEAMDGILGKMCGPADQIPFWPHLETLTINVKEGGTAVKKAFSVFLKHHQRQGADLTLRISDTDAMIWKETSARHGPTMYSTVAGLCIIEEFPAKEWYDPKPWPPGGDGVLSRRIDLDHSPLDRRFPGIYHLFDIPFVVPN